MKKKKLEKGFQIKYGPYTHTYNPKIKKNWVRFLFTFYLYTMGYKPIQETPFTSHVLLKQSDNRTPISERFCDAIRRRLVGLAVKKFLLYT